MKVFLIVSGVMAALLGAGLLSAPASVMGTLGLVIDAKIATLGQAQGAVLVGLAVMNVMALNLTGAAHAISVVIKLRAVLLALVSPQEWTSIGIHLVLGVLFAFFLARSRP
jgi:hypothetical protein